MSKTSKIKGKTQRKHVTCSDLKKRKGKKKKRYRNRKDQNKKHTGEETKGTQTKAYTDRKTERKHKMTEKRHTKGNNRAD